MDNVLHERCLRCGRKLTSEASKQLGYGKTCWEKFNGEDNWQELYPENLLKERSNHATIEQRNDT